MTIEEAIKEMESLSPSETAINMTLQHLKFYKDGLEREIEKNRENVFEIIEKDKEISYLKGKADTMEKIIREMNAPVEIVQAK